MYRDVPSVRWKNISNSRATGDTFIREIQKRMFFIENSKELQMNVDRQMFQMKVTWVIFSVLK